MTTARWDRIVDSTEMAVDLLIAVRSQARRFVRQHPECELDELEAHIEDWLDNQNLTADQWDTTAVSSLIEAVWLEEV